MKRFGTVAAAALIGTSVGAQELPVEQSVITCEPGDREILHIGQYHRESSLFGFANLQAEELITDSQAAVYAVLMRMAETSSVSALVEGVTDELDEDGIRYHYRRSSLKDNTESLNFDLFDMRRQLFAKEQNVRLVDELMQSFKSVVELGVEYDEVPQWFFDESAKQWFATSFPNQQTWQDKDVPTVWDDLLQQRQLAYDDYKALFDQYNSIITHGTPSFIARADNEITENPYFGGGTFKCALENQCTVLPAETVELNEAAGSARDKHGYDSAEFDEAQERRDDYAVAQVDYYWTENQEAFPLVYGNNHDFGPNVLQWNQANPDKEPFCLSKIDTTPDRF